MTKAINSLTFRTSVLRSSRFACMSIELVLVGQQKKLRVLEEWDPGHGRPGLAA
jgi:hypothetical protein